jgi:hypothetical protein
MAQSTANFRRHESPSLLFRLFGLFQPLAFAQSHAGPAAVLVDELDASAYELLAGLASVRRNCDVGLGEIPALEQQWG